MLHASPQHTNFNNRMKILMLCYQLLRQHLHQKVIFSFPFPFFSLLLFTCFLASALEHHPEMSTQNSDDETAIDSTSVQSTSTCERLQPMTSLQRSPEDTEAIGIMPETSELEDSIRSVSKIVKLMLRRFM